MSSDNLASSIETMRQNIHKRDAQMRMMLSGVAHEIEILLAASNCLQEFWKRKI